MSHLLACTVFLFTLVTLARCEFKTDWIEGNKTKLTELDPYDYFINSQPNLRTEINGKRNHMFGIRKRGDSFIEALEITANDDDVIQENMNIELSKGRITSIQVIDKTEEPEPTGKLLLTGVGGIGKYKAEIHFNKHKVGKFLYHIVFYGYRW